MTYIIYTNDRVHGYGFGKRSEQFPPAYEELVHDICGTVSDPQGVEDDSVAIRYSPVGERFLFSFIFRKPHGDSVQPRGHNTVVNLLLSAEEADELFSRPTDYMLRQLTAYAAHLVKEPARWKEVGMPEESVGWDREVCVFGAVPAAELLAGAALSETVEGDRPQQLFIALDGDPLQELKTLMCHLPEQLRKQVRFHTGIISAQESCGIALNFATSEKLRQIIAGHYDRAQSSDKFVWGIEGGDWSVSADVAAAAAHCAGIESLPADDFLRPLLMDTVGDWTTWRAWRDVDDDAFRLERTLALIPAERIREQLSNPDISVDALEALSKCRIYEVANRANGILREMKMAQERERKERVGEQMPDGEKVSGNSRVKEVQEKTEAELQVAADAVVEIRRTKGLGEKTRHLVAGLIRLVLLLTLLAILALVLRGFVWTDTIAEDKTVILIVSASQAANFVRLLATIGLTAAITALITVWSVKRKQGKK